MLYAIVTVLILILDQGLKYWTTLNIPLNVGVKELIPGGIRLTNIHNPGAAFGILQSAPKWLLAAVAGIFAIGVIALISAKVIRGSFGRWMAVMILAGALGNGIDRALHGYVVDMLEFDFFILKEFPVFNIADIFITVGGVLFCLYVIFHKDAVEVKKRDQVQKAPAVKQREGGDIRQVQKPVLTKKTASDPVLAAAAAAEAAKARAAAREAAQEAQILENLEKEQVLPAKEHSETEFTLEDILAEFSDK